MNIQNIPRQDKTIKRAIIPKQDALLFFDYSQIEYRLLAFYIAVACNDYSMVETFKAGKDLHTETARMMLNLPDDHELTDAERQVGKVGNFSVIYLGGAPTIMRQIGCSRKRAYEILDRFHELNPSIGRQTYNLSTRDWDPPEPGTLLHLVFYELETKGYIKTLWGRHLHPEFARLGLNALIQGGAADLLKQGMVRVFDWLEEEGLRSHMVLSVHDEIGVDAVDEEIPYLVDNIPTLMGDERLEEVLPILTDCQLSRTSWADKEDYAPGS